MVAKCVTKASGRVLQLEPAPLVCGDLKQTGVLVMRNTLDRSGMILRDTACTITYKLSTLEKASSISDKGEKWLL